MALSQFIAMYVGLKFVLVVFNAADAAERWTFELTPLAALNLPDVQLAFLASVATVTNAVLHRSTERKHRRWAILLSASMVAGLLLALRSASADLDPVNAGRLASLVLLLGMVSLDNVELLRVAGEVSETSEDFVTSELRAIAQQAEAVGKVTPAAAVEALRELEALVRDLPERRARPASAVTSSAVSDADDMRELMSSVLGKSGPPGGLLKASRTAVPRGPPAPKPEEDEDMEVAERIGNRPGFLRGRFVRSAAFLMEEARRLRDQGKLEKALRRLDLVADSDERYPGLWELAAEVYDRLGERDAAAECRRRAKESSR
jgi:tetratricopeptide (TPR) repeat protein